MANWGVLPQGPIQAKDKKTAVCRTTLPQVGESKSIPSVSWVGKGMGKDPNF